MVKASLRTRPSHTEEEEEGYRLPPLFATVLVPRLRNMFSLSCLELILAKKSRNTCDVSFVMCLLFVCSFVCLFKQSEQDFVSLDPSPPPQLLSLAVRTTQLFVLQVTIAVVQRG